jgi:class 3 adenylate cyclase
VCSVLFCDVVGFTPLSESRDPEAVRELLSEYFEVARTVIGRYGGVVEKFIGDAVMAVWGTPVTAEGDAERAVRAALDLVAAVAQLGGDVGVLGLAARVGVVTGEVAVTLGATNEGMVAGDAVNTAARVQAAADPGSVLVDGPTQRLAAGGVGFTDAGEHALKGKAEPQHLWRATWVLAGVGGSQRVDGLEAPLIGRDAELRTIKELFHAAAERRVPRMMVGKAIATLIRATERAERTGAPVLAATSYATAAELTTMQAGTIGGHADAGELWERAAANADISADYAMAVRHADRARDYHVECGEARAAARAQAIAGKALRHWGRLSEAREQLTAAVEVLRAEPDTDTVRALLELAGVEVFAGSRDADRLPPRRSPSARPSTWTPASSSPCS